MRTQRMDNGVCPLLDNHDHYTGVKKQYGSLIAYEVSDGEVRATIQFSKNPENNGIWTDIEAGIIRGISARYMPWVYERVAPKINTEKPELPTYRAIDWEITEVSLAPVPADYNSMVRSNETGEHFETVINNFQIKNNQRSNMEGQNNGEGQSTQQQPNTPAAGTETGRSQASAATTTVQNPLNETQIRAAAQAEERTRIATITSAVRTAGLEDSVATQLIDSGATLDQARAQIFEKMAAKQQGNNPAPRTATNIVVNGDEGEQIRSAMSDAILNRAEPGSVKLEGKAQDFKGMSMLDAARHMLQLNGETNVFRFSKNETVARAISTTDFPDLLTSTAQRQLRKYFEKYNSGSWKKIANRTSVSDFRAKTGVQVDGAVTLEKIAEGGDYKATKFLSNTKATISVDTYGRLIQIGRKAIINDDLDVFSRIPQMIAQGAVNMQAKMVWDMIFNNVNTPDGTALFHANHGNLAGAGAAITEASLQAAMLAIMKQQSPSKEELMLQPKYLIVPVEKEIEAKKLLTAIIASATGDVNVFANAFELISEIRASRNSATAWYMAADPASVEGLLYAYLDGEEGVYTESRTDFSNDNVEIKARLEFGVAAWEHRGWYKNPGA